MTKVSLLSITFLIQAKMCVCGCVSGADIRTVNMRELTSGVLHTKFWVVDKKHIYIGSANMDWRSLTQVHILSHRL